MKGGRIVRAIAIVVMSIAGGSSAAPAAEPAYPVYQKLLDDYLVVNSVQPLETRFDYIRLHDSPGRYEIFARVRRELFADSPAEMRPEVRRAWGINTYNFLVLEAVTHNLVSTNVTKYMRAEGRHGILNTLVQQIRVEGQDLFKTPLVEVDGQRYSLDTFERTFLFEGWDPKSGKPRPRGLDPRIHFALVCAAQGCPPLRPQAFAPESLGAQLDRATRDALASPAHLQWRPELGQVAASSIFNWYEADFGGPEAAFEFLKRYAPPALAPLLAAKPVRRIDQVLPWNWKINMVPQTARPRPTLQDSLRIGDF